MVSMEIYWDSQPRGDGDMRKGSPESFFTEDGIEWSLDAELREEQFTIYFSI